MSRVALVVDDSILIRNAVQRLLEDYEYQVFTACNGVEGLAALERVTPVLIVVDLIMPKLSGTEFIREVRHREDLSRIPIVVVAGRRHSSTHVFGADHVIYKEIDLVEQLQAILEDASNPPRPRTTHRAKPIVIRN